ncbi:hypothetical protein LPN04_02505 [Rugamonas sp. A1-17]|nr:hypothetical protein [Rugamonas sp. A1-17]
MLSRPTAHGALTQRWLPLLLGINVMLLLFYLAFDYQLVYHSDAAVKNLLAQEIVDTGRYFPPDWNYVNSDLWVFYTHTFIVPLLRFMPNGYLVAVISDLVTAALILYGSWLLTGLLEQSRLARLLGMLVVSSGMSLIMAEHIYGQAAYGSMYYMACFLLYAYWQLSQARGHRIALWGAATTVLVILVFWANPQRALLFYGLPLMSAAVVQQMLETRAARSEQRRPQRRHAAMLALLLAATVAGVLINKATLRNVNVGAGLTLINWLDFNGMLHNLTAVVAGLMSLFDGIPRANSKVASLFGVYSALRLLGALVLLGLLPWALYKALQARRNSRQLVVVFAAVSFCANLFVMVTTSLADMGSPDASVRYLVPSLLYMLLILVGVLVDRRALAPAARAAGLAAIALLATSGPTSLLYPYNEFIHLKVDHLKVQTPDQQVANFLRDQGLKYGYATFWNAGKITVLSDSAVKVRQVALERGLPQPSRRLSSNRWYTPEAWQGETFLMLREEELPFLDQPALARVAGQPRVLRVQNLTVLVYPGNLAASLPWDLSPRSPARYAMDSHTLHQIGHLDSALQALVANPGESGTLHFGPMRDLAAGSYDVGFDIETSGDGVDDFGHLDIATESGNKIHANQPITRAGKQRVVLRLDTRTALSQLEFRVFSSGKGQFIMRGVDIVRRAQENH